MKREIKIEPISLRLANEFVEKHHRHHKKVQGHKWSIGLYKNNSLIGVAIVGRPISRILDNGLTVEIRRVCTTGEKNACSRLYSHCAKVAFILGYQRIITYILETENGASLKASNFRFVKICGGGTWNRKNRSRINKHPIIRKKLYERCQRNLENC